MVIFTIEINAFNEMIGGYEKGTGGSWSQNKTFISCRPAFLLSKMGSFASQLETIYDSSEQGCFQPFV